MDSINSLFILIAHTLTPLFIYIIMGYIGGKVLKLETKTIATFLFYLVNPIAFFHNIAHTKFDHILLLIPIVYYIISSVICLIFYFIGKKIWDDETKNILAFASGTGNIGYILLPVITIIFGEQYIAPFFLIIMGISLYENTLGFYISAAGKYSVKNSILKVLKLPTLYAFCFAVLISAYEIELPSSVNVFTRNISNMFTVIGMMIIGLNLAAIKLFKLDFKFLCMGMAARYIAWPLFTILAVLIDKHITMLYSEKLHQLCIMSSFIPMSVNAMVVATILKSKPEKIATAVLITTISAIIYIPLIIKYVVL